MNPIVYFPHLLLALSTLMLALCCLGMIADESRRSPYAASRRAGEAFKPRSLSAWGASATVSAAVPRVLQQREPRPQLGLAA